MGRILIRLNLDGHFPAVYADLHRTGDLAPLDQAILSLTMLRDRLAEVYGDHADPGQCMHFGDWGRCRAKHGHDGEHLIPSEEQAMAELEAWAQGAWQGEASMSTTTTEAAPVIACPSWCEKRDGCEHERDLDGSFSRIHRVEFTAEGIVQGQRAPLVTAEVWQGETVILEPAGPRVSLDGEPLIDFDLKITSDEWDAREAREMAEAIHEVLTKAAALLEGVTRPPD
jgi:hypothetical protein